MTDYSAIVEAINNINSNTTWLEQYLFPVLGWLGALLAGYLLTKYGLKVSEKHNYDKEKLNTANELLLKMNEMVDTLISIKQIYHQSLTSNPIQRFMTIPVITSADEPMNFNYGCLSFIVKSESDNDEKKWRDIPRIMSYFKNFNYLLKTLDERNELKLEVNQLFLSEIKNQSRVELTEESIINKLGQLKMTYLIDHTEHLIILIDGLLLEGNDFLINFPKQVEKDVERKYLKKYGFKFLKFSNDGNEYRLEMFKKIIQLDYLRTSEITGRRVDEIKNNYDVFKVSQL